MVEIQEAVSLEHAVATTSWTACFENNKQCFRYRTLLAIGVNFGQQATGEICLGKPRISPAERVYLHLGINIATYVASEPIKLSGRLMHLNRYYAGSIFIQGIGLPVDTALLVLGNLGVVGLIFAAAGCFYFVDNVGRVRTMMIGTVLNCIGMCLL
jgi:hypothetical protein